MNVFVKSDECVRTAGGDLILHRPVFTDGRPSILTHIARPDDDDDDTDDTCRNKGVHGCVRNAASRRVELIMP